MLDRLLELRLDRRGFVGMGLFLRLEGLLHRLDLLVEAARQTFEGLLGFLFQRLLAGLERLLIFDDQLRLRRFEQFFLPVADFLQALFVAVLGVG